MANNYFKGGATAVAQIAQKNVGSSTSTQTFIITLAYENGTTVAVMTHTVDGVDAGNATTVATEIATEFNLLTHELATPITASHSGSVVVLTADTAGVPFYVTYSGTGTWDNTGATNTANAGPADWNTAANWYTGAVPANGDYVAIDARMANAITYGLNQSAVTLAQLDIFNTRPYPIGTSTTPLNIGATIGRFYAPSQDGAAPASNANAFINITGGTIAYEWTFYGTGGTGSGGLAPAVVGGNNSSNVLNIQGGTVWVSRLAPGETGQFATVNVSGGTVTLGTGITLGTLNNTGGTVTVEKVGSSQTINTGGGTTRLQGAVKAGTVNCDGGETFINSRVAGTGSDATAITMNGGTLNLQESSTDFKADTLTIGAGGGTIKLQTATQPTWTAVAFDLVAGEAEVKFRVAA